MGASLSMLAERLEGKLTRASALIGLRQQILQRIGDRATDDRYPVNGGDKMRRCDGAKMHQVA